VYQSGSLRKLKLECTRMAADCMQLGTMFIALPFSRNSFGW
jgi:hypothetical protein